MYEGFVGACVNRERWLYREYSDICAALARPLLQGEARTEADTLTGPLQELLGGSVELRGTSFYVDLGDGFREAHLIPEGYRRLAMLTRLCQNGSILPGTVLLWDKPEAGLHPWLIVKVAAALHRVATGGAQVLLATHDYLLAHNLSLVAEYAVEPKVEMRFFALHHERRTDPVQVEAGKTIAQIQNNLILDEYANHHDHERALFRECLDRDLRGAP